MDAPRRRPLAAQDTTPTGKRRTAMAISVSLTVAPAAPGHGDTVTATYKVTGNDAGGSEVATVNGAVTIGGTDYQVSATITEPGAPALAESYAVPSCPGLTFRATADPHVFTAVVP